jgi:hypothetical protein
MLWNMHRGSVGTTVSKGVRIPPSPPLVRYNLLFFKENLVQNYPQNGPQAVNSTNSNGLHQRPKILCPWVGAWQ